MHCLVKLGGSRAGLNRYVVKKLPGPTDKGASDRARFSEMWDSTALNVPVFKRRAKKVKGSRNPHIPSTRTRREAGSSTETLYMPTAGPMLSGEEFCLPFVGIDLGTSFIKGAVLDAEACRVEHVRRIPFPPTLPGLNPLYCEFAPEQILAAARALIEELATLAVECEGLVMCTQLGSLMLMNGQGQAASNFFGWQDQRALEPHPSGAGSYYRVLQER